MSEIDELTSYMLRTLPYERLLEAAVQQYAPPGTLESIQMKAREQIQEEEECYGRDH